jgi:hypothetical protein
MPKGPPLDLPGGADVPSDLWSRLAHRDSEIADRIFVRLRERLPSLNAASPALAADVRTATRSTLGMILTIFRTGQPLDVLHARVHDLAFRRAAEGTIPLEDSLLAYEIAAVELLDTVANEVDHGRAGKKALVDASRRLIELLQTTTSAVAAAYQRATETAAADFEHRVAALLEIFVGRRPDDGRSDERARTLGAELPLRWCAVSSPLGTDAGDSVRLVRRALPIALVGRLDGRLVILSAVQPPQLPVATLGVAPIAAEGIACAFDVAAAAASLGLHLGQRRIDAASLGPLAVLLTTPPSVLGAFVSTHLGPLAEERHEDLLLSLAAWLRAGGSTVTAARALFVHRHTLDYRMAKVREITGLDLNDPAQRFLVQTALFIIGRYP